MTDNNPLPQEPADRQPKSNNDDGGAYPLPDDDGGGALSTSLLRGEVRSFYRQLYDNRKQSLATTGDSSVDSQPLQDEEDRTMVRSTKSKFASSMQRRGTTVQQSSSSSKKIGPRDGEVYRLVSSLLGDSNRNLDELVGDKDADEVLKCEQIEREKERRRQQREMARSGRRPNRGAQHFSALTTAPTDNTANNPEPVDWDDSVWAPAGSQHRRRSSLGTALSYQHIDGGALEQVLGIAKDEGDSHQALTLLMRLEDGSSTVASSVVPSSRKSSFSQPPPHHDGNEATKLLKENEEGQFEGDDGQLEQWSTEEDGDDAAQHDSVPDPELENTTRQKDDESPFAEYDSSQPDEDHQEHFAHDDSEEKEDVAHRFLAKGDPRLARLKKMQRDRMKQIWKKISYGLSDKPVNQNTKLSATSPARRSKSALEKKPSTGIRRARSSSVSPGRANDKSGRLPPLPHAAKGMGLDTVRVTEDAFLRRKQSLIATIDAPKMPSRHDLIEALRAAKQHFMSLPLRSIAELVPLPYEDDVDNVDSFWLGALAESQTDGEAGVGDSSTDQNSSPLSAKTRGSRVSFFTSAQGTNNSQYRNHTAGGSSQRQLLSQRQSVVRGFHPDPSRALVMTEGHDLLRQQGEDAVLLSTLASSVSHSDTRLTYLWKEMKSQINEAQESGGLDLRCFGVVPKTSAHDIFSTVKYVVLSPLDRPREFTIALASDPMPTRRYAGSTYTSPEEAARKEKEEKVKEPKVSVVSAEEEANGPKKQNCGDVLFLPGIKSYATDRRQQFELHCVEGKEMMFLQAREHASRLHVAFEEVIGFLETGIEIFKESEDRARRQIHLQQMHHMNGAQSTSPSYLSGLAASLALSGYGEDALEDAPENAAAEILTTYSHQATRVRFFKKWLRFFKEHNPIPRSRREEILAEMETRNRKNFIESCYLKWRLFRLTKRKPVLAPSEAPTTNDAVPVHKWTAERALTTAATLSKILRKIGADPRKSTVNLVGHGAGGAIATAMAVVWNSQGGGSTSSSADFVVESVRCLSSPKIFPVDGEDIISDLGLDLRHYAVNNDPLVVIPSSFSTTTNTIFELRSPVPGLNSIGGASNHPPSQKEMERDAASSPDALVGGSFISCLNTKDFLSPTAEFGFESRKLHNLEHAKYVVEGLYPSPYMPRGTGTTLGAPAGESSSALVTSQSMMYHQSTTQRKSNTFSMKMLLQTQELTATMPFDPHLQTFEAVAGSISGYRRLHQTYFLSSTTSDLSGQIQAISGSSLRSVFSPAILSVLADTHELLVRRSKDDVFVTQASRIPKEDILGVCALLQPYQPLYLICRRLQKFAGGRSMNQSQFVAWCGSEFLMSPQFLFLFLHQGFGWNFEGSVPHRTTSGDNGHHSSVRQHQGYAGVETSANGEGGMLYSSHFVPRPLDALYPELLEKDENGNISSSSSWTGQAKMAIHHIFAHYSRTLPSSPFDTRTGSVPTAGFDCLNVMLHHSQWPLPISVKSYNEAAFLELEAEHLKKPRAGLLNFSGEVAEAGFRSYFKIMHQAFGERFVLERLWVLGYNELFQHSITRGAMRNIHSRGGTSCPCTLIEAEQTKVRKEEEVEFRRWVAHHVEESQKEMIRMSRLASLKKIKSMSTPKRKMTLHRLGREQDKGLGELSLFNAEQSSPQQRGGGNIASPAALAGSRHNASIDVYGVTPFSESNVFRAGEGSLSMSKSKKSAKKITKANKTDDPLSLSLDRFSDDGRNSIVLSSELGNIGPKKPSASHLIKLKLRKEEQKKKGALSYTVPPKPEPKPRGPAPIGEKLAPIKNTAPSVAKAYSAGPVRVLNPDQQLALS